MPEVTIEQAMTLALQHHQVGRLAEAESIYRQILAQQPNHFDAMHNLGVIAHQTGRNDLAVGLIRQSIALRPNHADVYSNLGLALQAMGQLDEAITAYRQAIALKPDFAEAHSNLGNALQEKGQLDEAIAECRRAIALKPNCAEAHLNLGVALKFKGQLDEAIVAHRQAIALRPNHAEARFNLGCLFSDQNRIDDAIASYRQAIALRPDYGEAYCNLGNALRDKGQLDDAIAAYNMAIQIKPDFAGAILNLEKFLIFILRCPPLILPELDEIGLTRGGTCGKDGINFELAGIMDKPIADLKTELRKYLMQRRSKLKDDDYITLYHPRITAELVRNLTNAPVLEIKGETIEEILNAIPLHIRKILPPWDHRKLTLPDITAIPANFPPHPCSLFLNPKSKMAVFTLWTRELEKYAQLTVSNNMDYCKRNNYDFIAQYEKIDAFRPASWSKIPLILAYIRDYEWCLWIDADAAIINKSITIESLVSDYRECDLIISRDAICINNGVFILKNTQASINMLISVYNKTRYVNHFWWEQRAIMDVLDDESCPVKVGYIPKNRINSYPYDYKAGDFILHTPGLKYKHNILRKYIRP